MPFRACCHLCLTATNFCTTEELLTHLFERHQKQTHPKARSFACGVAGCNWTGAFKMRLIEHLVESGHLQSPFYCDHEDHGTAHPTFASQADLDIHAERAHPRRRRSLRKRKTSDFSPSSEDMPAQKRRRIEEDPLVKQKRLLDQGRSKWEGIIQTIGEARGQLTRLDESDNMSVCERARASRRAVAEFNAKVNRLQEYSQTFLNHLKAQNLPEVDHQVLESKQRAIQDLIRKKRDDLQHCANELDKYHFDEKQLKNFDEESVQRCNAVCVIKAVTEKYRFGDSPGSAPTLFGFDSRYLDNFADRSQNFLRPVISQLHDAAVANLTLFRQRRQEATSKRDHARQLQTKLQAEVTSLRQELEQVTVRIELADFVERMKSDVSQFYEVAFKFELICNEDWRKFEAAVNDWTFDDLRTWANEADGGKFAQCVAGELDLNAKVFVDDWEVARFLQEQGVSDISLNVGFRVAIDGLLHGHRDIKTIKPENLDSPIGTLM